MKWILKYLLKLPAKTLCGIAITLLKEIAERTDNTVDDEAIDVIEFILEGSFDNA